MKKINTILLDDANYFSIFLLFKKIVQLPNINFHADCINFRLVTVVLEPTSQQFSN
jgi:hypothetical protein